MSTDKASVNKDTVKNRSFSKAHIPEEQQEKIAGELNAILNWIEELNEVDTTGVQPLSSVTGHELPQREDVVSDGNKVEDILANAPEEASGFFVVPKVVE
ncbi:MAG: aspartyl/glutamyl-tRNA(Asn/Gln) amidotransferase subunit C [Alphaproteobacteria bacterium]|nr:MAG: aspartyl/glutamyl-tRNA(Asn/Gln) amidotransferase subunit C [Alphaproteobacteria bacterium]